MTLSHAHLTTGGIHSIFYSQTYRYVGNIAPFTPCGSKDWINAVLLACVLCVYRVSIDATLRW